MDGIASYRIQEDFTRSAFQRIAGVKQWPEEPAGCLIPSQLLPKAQLANEPEGTRAVHANMQHLKNLTWELDSITTRFPDIVPQEAAMRNDSRDCLDVARAVVRMREISVEFETTSTILEASAIEGAEVVSTGYSPRYCGPDMLGRLRNEVAVWEREWPAIKAEWENVFSRAIGVERCKVSRKRRRGDSNVGLLTSGHKRSRAMSDQSMEVDHVGLTAPTSQVALEIETGAWWTEPFYD